MASQSSLYLFTAFLAALIGSSTAHKFIVGGKAGWIKNPSENYNHWAERTRFQVNDTLVFKYKNGQDSVLIVNREDYNTCNLKNPVEKFDGGDSIFKFYRSGPFYFISGHADNCMKGQKLIVVVLAVRIKYPPPPPSSLSPPPPPFPHQAPAHPGGETSTPSPATPAAPASISVPPHHKSAGSIVSRQSLVVMWMIIMIINNVY